MNQKILEIVIKAKEQAHAAFEKASSGLAKVQQAAKYAGAALTGFGIAATAALLSTIGPYAEAKNAELMLQNTIKNMPKLHDENIKGFKELANQLQTTTAVEGDAAIKGMALLGTFNLTGKEVRGITPLVADYARKFKTDFSQASIQVGKALDGQMGALKKNGVSIDEVLYKTDRYAAVQKALREQVGGFAREEAASGIVAGERLQNVIGDLTEVVGEVVAKAINPFIGRFQDFISKVNEANPGLLQLIAKGAILATVISLIAGPLLLLIGYLPTISAGFTAISAAIGTIGAGPILIVVGAVAALAAAAYLVYKNFGTIKQYLINVWTQVKPSLISFKNFFLGIWQGMQPTIETVRTYIKQVFDWMVGAVKGSLLSAWDNLKEAWVQLKPVLMPLVPVLKTIGIILGGAVVIAIGLVAGGIMGLIVAISKLVQGITWLISQFIYAVTHIKQTWETIKSTIFSAANSALSYIKNLGSQALNNVKDYFTSKLPQQIGYGIGLVIGYFKDLPGKILGFLTSTYNNVKNKFDDAKEAATKTTSNLVTSVVQFFQGLPGKIVSLITNLPSKISETFQSAKKLAVDALNSLLDFVRQMPAKMFSIASNIGSSLFKGLTGWFSKIGKGLGDALDPSKRHSPSALDRLQDGLEKAIKHIKGFIFKAKQQLGDLKNRVGGLFSKFGSKIEAAMEGKKLGAEINKAATPEDRAEAEKRYQQWRTEQEERVNLERLQAQRDAVEALIKSGKITKQQAQVKMEALLKQSGLTDEDIAAVGINFQDSFNDISSAITETAAQIREVAAKIASAEKLEDKKEAALSNVKKAQKAAKKTKKKGKRAWGGWTVGHGDYELAEETEELVLNQGHTSALREVLSFLGMNNLKPAAVAASGVNIKVNATVRDEADAVLIAERLHWLGRARGW